MNEILYQALSSMKNKSVLSATGQKNSSLRYETAHSQETVLKKVYPVIFLPHLYYYM